MKCSNHLDIDPTVHKISVFPRRFSTFIMQSYYHNTGTKNIHKTSKREHNSWGGHAVTNLPLFYFFRLETRTKTCPVPASEATLHTDASPAPSTLAFEFRNTPARDTLRRLIVPSTIQSRLNPQSMPPIPHPRRRLILLESLRHRPANRHRKLLLLWRFSLRGSGHAADER